MMKGAHNNRLAWFAAISMLSCTILLTPHTSSAHTRSVSYATWTLSETSATVRVRLTAFDVNALRGAIQGTSTRSVPDFLQTSIGLRSARGSCSADPDSFVQLAGDDGWTRFGWSVSCSERAKSVSADPVLTVLPSHVHLVAVRDTTTGKVSEVVLGEAQRSSDLFVSNETGDSPSSIMSFIGLGAEHILGGWDHLVFLLTLVLVCASFRDAAVILTGFTIGHSVTLCALVLGMCRVDAGTMEAFIGLSIVVVAAENVWTFEEEGRARRFAPLALVVSILVAALFFQTAALGLVGVALFVACYFGLQVRASKPERLRWSVALLFGLVHGMGFAAALQGLSLPIGRELVSLLGFNLGVEVGQLAILAIVWPVIIFVRRRGDGAERSLVHWGSAAAGTAGAFWFVDRLGS